MSIRLSSSWLYKYSRQFNVSRCIYYNHHHLPIPSHYHHLSNVDYLDHFQRLNITSVRFFNTSLSNLAKQVRTADQYTFSTRFPKKKLSNRNSKIQKKSGRPHDKVSSLSEIMTLAKVKNHTGKEATHIIIKKEAKIKPARSKAKKQIATSTKRRNNEEKKIYAPTTTATKTDFYKGSVVSSTPVKKRVLRVSPVPSDNPNDDTRRNAELFRLKPDQDIQYSASITEFKAGLTKRLSQVHDFKDLGLHPKVVHAVQQIGIGKPNEIQKLTITRYMDGHRNIMMAAETGSGKTLAYLLPIFHDIVQQDQQIMTQDITNQPLVITGIDENGVKQLQNNSLANMRAINRPRVLVVVPSRQLVNQVTEIAKELSHHAKLRVVGVHSKIPRRVLVKKFRDPVDLIVTTQAGLAWLMSPVKRSVDTKLRRATANKSKSEHELTRKGFGMSMNRCTHLVIDEMDTLFDRYNRYHTTKLFETMKAIDQNRLEKQKSNSKVKATLVLPQSKIILATATLSTFVSKELKHLLPGYVEAVSRNIHCTPTNVKQIFARIDKSSSTKQNYLLELLKRSFLEGDKRVLVFCNKTEHVRQVARFLKDKNMNVFPFLSGEKNMKRLHKWVQPFTMDPSKTKSEDGIESSDPSFESKEKLINKNKISSTTKNTAEEENELVDEEEDIDNENDKKAYSIFDEFDFNTDPSMPMICVATDLASRGLNTLSVSHVILYDCPVTPIDYLHRVGRTGRNGQPGRATSIITKKDVPLMAWIEDKVRKRKSLAL